MTALEQPIWTHPAIAGRHVVSMTCAVSEGGWVDSVATCQCGWISRRPMTEYRDQDRSVEAHWQSVVDAEANAA